MLTYEKLKTRPAIFQRLAGVTIEEFEILHDTFASMWKEYVYQEFIQGKDRKRVYGGGNTSRLAKTEDKLLYVLLYVRIYPLQFIQGIWFDLAESNANRWIHRLVPILKSTLGFKGMLPKRKRGRTIEEIGRDFPELSDFLIDGMEQPIRRPKDTNKQKNNYSGKKKRHTKKNIVISDSKKGYIHGIGSTQPGSMHDKTAADEEELRGSPDVDIGGDSGFQGYMADNARIIIPTKKPKGNELSESIKNQNTVLSRIRIKVEHGIGGIKRSHIAADIFRNTKDGFDDMSMLVAVGLHNYRVIHRYP